MDFMIFQPCGFLEKQMHVTVCTERCAVSIALVRRKAAVTSYPCYLRALENLLHCGPEGSSARCFWTLVTSGLCRTCAGWPPRCSHSARATPSRLTSSVTPCVCGSSSQERFHSLIWSQVGLLHHAALTEIQRDWQKACTTSLLPKIIIRSGWQENLCCLKVSILFTKRNGLTLDLN